MQKKFCELILSDPNKCITFRSLLSLKIKKENMPEKSKVHSQSRAVEARVIWWQQHRGEFKRYPGHCQGGSSGHKARQRV